MMNIKWLIRMLQATAITVTMAAVCQELEKPKEERKWYGQVVGFIPYDFRLPTIERLKESYWNQYESRVFSPEVSGVGWAINFHALLEKIKLIKESDGSEEDFLMPGSHMKEVLTHALEAE